MKTYRFRGGRFLARVFLLIEPVVGLPRSQRLMAFLISHPPFKLDEWEGV